MRGRSRKENQANAEAYKNRVLDVPLSQAEMRRKQAAVLAVRSFTPAERVFFPR